MPDEDQNIKEPIVKSLLNLERANLLLDAIKKLGLITWVGVIILTAARLWIYLVDINAQELLLKSVISMQGLTALFFIALLISSVFFVMLYLPSLLVLSIDTSLETNLPSIHILYLFLGSSLGSLVVLLIVTYFDKSTWIHLASIPILSIAALFVGYIVLYRRAKKVDNDNIKGENIGFHFLLLILIILANLCVIIPLTFIIKIWDRPEDYSFGWFYLIAPLTFIVSYAPSIFYTLVKETQQKHPRNLISITVISSLIGLCVISVLPINFTYLVFKQSGVASDNLSSYQLIDTSLKASVIYAGLDQSDESSGELFSNDLIFKAYTWYNFGGQRLLCKLSRTQAQKNRLEANKETLSNNCIAFNANEIKIIYEHIKAPQ